MLFFFLYFLAMTFSSATPLPGQSDNCYATEDGALRVEFSCDAGGMCKGESNGAPFIGHGGRKDDVGCVSFTMWNAEDKSMTSLIGLYDEAENIKFIMLSLNNATGSIYFDSEEYLLRKIECNNKF